MNQIESVAARICELEAQISFIEGHSDYARDAVRAARETTQDRTEAVKSRILELQTLVNNGACAEQVKLFREKFGESVLVTEDLCVSVAREFYFDWAAKHLLSPAAWAEYERAVVSARAEYERIKAPALYEYKCVVALAWAEYERVTESARAEQKHVTESAQAEYKRVAALAWSEYKCVVASTWAEYERIKAPAWAEYERIKASTFARAYLS